MCLVGLRTINHWIRTSGAFDGVIDLAKVLANPNDPDIMNPIYDSGGHRAEGL